MPGLGVVGLAALATDVEMPARQIEELIADLARPHDRRAEGEVAFLVPVVDHLIDSGVAFAGDLALERLRVMEEPAKVAELFAVTAGRAATSPVLLSIATPSGNSIGASLELERFR